MISKQGCLGLISKAVKHWKNIIKHLEKDSEIWHLFFGGVGVCGEEGRRMFLHDSEGWEKTFVLCRILVSTERTSLL